ncbi:MAG: hypothetical protein AAB499_00005, partial [Patescibacteria group bacterium]
SQIPPRLSPISSPGIALKFSPFSNRLALAVMSVMAICLRDQRFQQQVVLAASATALASYLITRLDPAYLAMMAGLIVAVVIGLAYGCLAQSITVASHLYKRLWPAEPILWARAAFWSGLILTLGIWTALNGVIIALGRWSLLAFGLTILLGLAVVGLSSLIINIRPQPAASS